MGSQEQAPAAVVRLEPIPKKPREGAVTRFFAGMAYPWKGIGFTFKNPPLLALAFAPIVLTIVVVVLLFSGASHLASSLSHRFAGHGFFGSLLYTVIMAVVVLAVYFVGFVAVLSLASAPFCSSLSDRTEALAAGRKIPKHGIGHVITEAARGLLHAILSLGLYLIISVPISLAGALIAPLAPFFWFAGFVVTAYFFAYGYFDFPLSSRCTGFGEKWDWLAKNRADSLGFGSMVGLMVMIPGFNLFIAPFATVGAALLYGEIEKRNAGR
jgi:CysZ protein